MLSRILPFVLVLSACATAEAPKTATAAPVKETKRVDVDPGALCQIVAEVDDAEARQRLADLRGRYEQKGALDRSQRFGAMLAISGDQDRFRAFHEDVARHPDSAVGPLGECFVYAQWKMADQAAGVCAIADQRLNGAAIVQVARARLERRQGQLDQAQTLVDNALGVDEGCTAALIEAARVQQAKGASDQALADWQRAQKSWPQCYLCAVETAKLVEQRDGKEAAVAHWEAALKIAPDAAEALKRLGAALAGKDDARALAAYERAILAGVADLPTLLGAAQLAAAAGDNGKALAYAERATNVQRNEIDAWRLVLAIATKQGENAKAVAAAKEVLRLVDEDVTALLVLGREARADGNLVEAVLRYDQAARAAAAGRTGGLDEASLSALKKEHTALLTELMVDLKGAKGRAESVVGSVKRTVQTLFVERLKKKRGMKGSIDLSVVVSESGTVDDVEVVKDTLGDPAVTASVVANLRRANITGGAKRYSFSMDFK